MPSRILASGRTPPRRNVVRSVPQYVLEWLNEDLDILTEKLKAILDTNPSPEVADLVLDSLKLLKSQSEEIRRRTKL